MADAQSRLNVYQTVFGNKAGDPSALRCVMTSIDVSMLMLWRINVICVAQLYVLVVS